MRGGGRVEKGGNLKEMREWFLKVFFQGGFDTVFSQSKVKFGSSWPVILTIVASSLRLQWKQNKRHDNFTESKYAVNFVAWNLTSGIFSIHTLLIPNLFSISLNWRLWNPEAGARLSLQWWKKASLNSSRFIQKMRPIFKDFQRPHWIFKDQLPGM